MQQLKINRAHRTRLRLNVRARLEVTCVRARVCADKANAVEPFVFIQICDAVCWIAHSWRTPMLRKPTQITRAPESQALTVSSNLGMRFLRSLMMDYELAPTMDLRCDLRLLPPPPLVLLFP